MSGSRTCPSGNEGCVLSPSEGSIASSPFIPANPLHIPHPLIPHPTSSRRYLSLRTVSGTVSRVFQIQSSASPLITFPRAVFLKNFRCVIRASSGGLFRMVISGMLRSRKSYKFPATSPREKIYNFPRTTYKFSAFAVSKSPSTPTRTRKYSVNTPSSTR